jgi:hypothetical protein
MDLSGAGFQSAGNVGVCALALGLIAIPLVKARDLTFRDSIWTALVFSFIAKSGLSILVGVHMLYVSGVEGRFADVATVGLYSAAYTAALAPYVHWMLKQLRGPLGVGVSYRWGVR